jgi:PKD repeat protein/CubicO group peptidase (beta-lactamase class C family)
LTALSAGCISGKNLWSLTHISRSVVRVPCGLWAIVLPGSLLTLACDPGRSTSPLEPSLGPSPPRAHALSGYYPPSEASGGWRTTSDPERILELGIDASKLGALGSYLMSRPSENYNTGVTGYDPTNKAAIVIKNGWIVGEYYNQPSARTGIYYLASNGKSLAMLLTGRLARDYPQLALDFEAKLYDQRWLPQGFPLSDGKKADITFDQVFRHTSGIIPEGEAAVASSAVRPQSDWNFAPATVGKDPDYPITGRLFFTPGDSSTYTGTSTYSSVAFNHLSLIFRNVTGQEASTYLRQAMLNRIGVDRMAYKLTKGMGDYVWATAGNGLTSARDFARLGYLMLYEGEWEGAEIYPAAWQRRFTSSPAYRNIRSNVDCRWGAKYPADMYRTTGAGLNWMLVVPSLDLVLTYNGRTPKSQAAAVDSMSLKHLFVAVTERYVACDGTVVNDVPPTTNAPPAADFSSSCTGLACGFTDGSTDADGSVTAWAWDFGDGSTAEVQSPSHTYAAEGSYTVSLTVTDDEGATGAVSGQVIVSLPGSNEDPVAGFTSSCTNLACGFTDQSTDSDGNIVAWSWSFGDGGTSSAQNPGRTYSTAGSYTVTLTVTDDDGATHQHSAAVTVTAPPPSSITLTISGRVDAEKHYITHLWSGATGSSMDLYRNGMLINSTPNDGRHTTAHKYDGTATWRVKVCLAGSTSVCSPERSITLSN